MTTPFYQIGWSDTHHRDIRLEVEGSMSAPIIRISRYMVNGEATYVRLLMGEAMRLYNALGQFLGQHQQCTKQYREPEKDWVIPEPEPEDDDDPLGSD